MYVFNPGTHHIESILLSTWSFPLKFLRKILSRIPYRMLPTSPSLDYVIISLTLGLLTLTPLGFVLRVTATPTLGTLVTAGSILLFGIPLAFCFFIEYRRYLHVGHALHDPLFMAGNSLEVAKSHFKKSGLGKNSEPARLLKEAQEFYSHLCFSAASLNSEMDKFDPQHWLSSPGNASKVPQRLNDELLHLIELAEPLKDFMEVFNQAMARESSESFKTHGGSSLDRLAGSFKESLDAAAERTLVNSAAMLEIEKMLEDDIKLKIPVAEPTSRFFGKRRKAAKPSLLQ